MKSINGKRRQFLGILGVLALSTACGNVPGPVADVQGDKKDEADDGDEAKDEAKDGKTVADGSNVVLSGTLALDGVSLTGFSLAPTLETIVMFCITFEETPRVAKSDFDATGKFSLEVPKGVNFGCFVNDKATGKTLASVVVEAAEGSFGSGQSALALGGSLDLGSLTIGEDGTIKIPQAVLATAQAVMTAGINPDEMHNSEYGMSCQDTGDAEALAKCKENIMEGGDEGTVFLRILKGKKGDGDVMALGVWRDKASFDACGGFDMTQAEVDKLGAEAGVSLTDVSIGAFTESATCSKRSDGELNGKNIQNYYALSQLVANGSGFSFRSVDEDHGGGEGGGNNNQQPGGNNQQPGGNNQQPGGNNQQPGGNNQQPGGNNQQPGGNNQQPGGNNQQPGGNNQQPGGNNQGGSGGGAQNCKRQHVTGIEFTGSASTIFGAFATSEIVTGSAECSAESSFDSFNVKFTKK